MIGLALLLCLVLVVVLIIVLTRLAEISSQIRILEERFTRLSKEFQEVRSPVEAIPPRAATLENRVPGVTEEMPGPREPVAEETPTQTQEAILPPAPFFPTTPPPPSRTREEWEALIGGKLLNRIGALALVIGIGFFLKYAFDNNWLSETVRVVLGAVAGVLLLAGAARSRKSGLLIFAQGLVGAGIAILYLSVYASFNYYSLVTQPVAFVLMATVTVIAFTQAFLYDSIAVSLLGWVGGFMTPFMLSTGEANEIGLFSYIALLAAGMLVAVMKKEKWAILEPMTLAATFFIFFLWFDGAYKQEFFAETLFFALIFWALFFLVDIVNSVRKVEVLPELRYVAAVFNAALFYLALFLLINHDHHEWMGATTFILGAIYLSTALMIRRSRTDAGGSFARLMSTAIVLLILAPAIEFKRFTITLYWSMEALVLAWCGRRWNLRFARISAFALYAIAAWGLLVTDGALVNPTPESNVLLLNMRTAAFVLLAVSMGIAGVLFRKEPLLSSPGGQWKLQSGAATFLHFGWSFLIIALFTVEINDLFRHIMIGASRTTMEELSFQRYMTHAVVWAFLAIAFIVATKQRSLLPLAYSGIFIMLLAMGMAAIRGVAFAPIDEFELVINYRMVAMLLVITATIVMAASLRKLKHMEWGPESADIIAVSAVFLILVLLTGEVRDLFEQKLSRLGLVGTDVADSSTALENLKQLSLSGVWLLYSISLMGIGIWRRVRSLRVISIVLFGATILKIFIYDLSFLETLYRIFSFIGLGVVLLLASYLYQHFKDVIFEEAPKEEAEAEETTA